MGTNFYWKETLNAADHWDGRDESHIGKRSAAGWFCYDCNHAIGGGIAPDLVRCQVCGKGHEAEPALESRGNPAGLELGFAPPNFVRPTGVDGASAFTWAQEPATVIEKLQASPDAVLVVDEYGREMTCRTFLTMLDAQCPIRRTDSIGMSFS